MRRKDVFPLCPAALAGLAATLMLSASPAVAADSCDGTWTVRSGDTLSSIAHRCGTTVAAIMQENPKIADPARLSVGWQIFLSAAEADGADETAPARADGPVLLSGRVFNGRRCAKLKTEDGKEYGMVGPSIVFVNGQTVDVQARMVDDPSCTGPKTLLVTELTASEM